MTKITLTPPSGSRDFLPKEALFREKIFSTVKSIFTRHGYAPFQTPAFERLETLTGKYGEEGEKLIFKILKRGEKAASGEADLALRYDLTVPTMRVYAQRRNDMPRIVKRYQVAPVWRADRPGRGRFREFYQCDVDVIGSNSLLADVDVLLTLSDAIETLGITNYTIRLNSRLCLQGLMSACKIPVNMHQSVLTALDKIDKIGVEGVIDELREASPPNSTLEELIRDLESPDLGSSVRSRVEAHPVGKEGLRSVDNIANMVKPFLRGGKIKVDPILARGLDYYTGPIFEFVVDDGIGSIAGGGRYDGLSSMFMKEKVPVCGGSLGIERILMLLSQEVEYEERVGASCYVTVWDDTFYGDALALVHTLQSIGVSAEIDLLGGKLGRQLKAADERGCSLVLVQGPDEKKLNRITIKEMGSGNQQTVPQSGAPEHIKKLIAGL